MRTITEIFLERLKAQADEADVRGLTKLANVLTVQVGKNSIRKNDEFYSYAANELKTDVENSIWDAVVRIADFYGTSFDALDIEKTVEAVADTLIENIEVKVGAVHGVGAYESTLPGEEKNHVSLEVVEK